MVVDGTHCLSTHFIVVCQLIGDRSHSRLLDTGHIVIPQVNSMIGVFPVRHPSEIRWINIRGQPLFEAMQLVRADKMHFAGQTGAIAHKTHIVSERGHGRRHIRRIVVSATA